MCFLSNYCQHLKWRHMGRSVVVLVPETADRRLAHREKSLQNLNSGLVVRSNRGNTTGKQTKTAQWCLFFLALARLHSHLLKVKYHSELHRAAVTRPRGAAAPSQLSPGLTRSRRSASIKSALHLLSVKSTSLWFCFLLATRRESKHKAGFAQLGSAALTSGSACFVSTVRASGVTARLLWWMELEPKQARSQQNDFIITCYMLGLSRTIKQIDEEGFHFFIYFPPATVTNVQIHLNRITVMKRDFPLCFYQIWQEVLVYFFLQFIRLILLWCSNYILL